MSIAAIDRSFENHMVPNLMEEVLSQKRINFQEKVNTRFQGKNLVKEAIYVTSDVATAGFSLMQGISLLTKPSPELAMIGSISGLIGGVLNIGQGLFLVLEAVQFGKNGQYEQFARILADGLILIGIGLLMTLASLSILGLKLGGLSGAAAIAANPYTIPILFLILVTPGLIQTLKHIALEMQGKDLGSELKNPNWTLQNPYLDRLKALDASSSPKEDLSQIMEEITEKVGVEAGMDVFEVLKMILQEESAAKLQEKLEEANTQVAKWNRIVHLRALQLTLFGLTAPVGLSSAFLAPASKVMKGVSKIFLSIPSTLGAYMDACEPFKRNNTLSVPKV